MLALRHSFVLLVSDYGTELLYKGLVVAQVEIKVRMSPSNALFEGGFGL